MCLRDACFESCLHAHFLKSTHPSRCNQCCSPCSACDTDFIAPTTCTQPGQADQSIRDQSRVGVHACCRKSRKTGVQCIHPKACHAKPSSTSRINFSAHKNQDR